MGKKTLLNEATVRKFMKLANIDRLTDTFVNEAYHAEEEEFEEGMYAEKEEELEEAMHDEGEHEEGMGKYMEAAHDEGMHAEGEHEDVDMDAGDEMDAEAKVDDTSEASIEKLVDALADTISQVTGVEVTATGDVEAPEDMGPVDDAPLDDMGDMMGDEADKGGEDLDAAPEDEEVLEAMHAEEELDEDAIVAETMRRVKARLRAMDKSEKLVESLTEKIYDRLAAKK